MVVKIRNSKRQRHFREHLAVAAKIFLRLVCQNQLRTIRLCCPQEHQVFTIRVIWNSKKEREINQKPAATYCQTFSSKSKTLLLPWIDEYTCIFLIREDSFRMLSPIFLLFFIHVTFYSFQINFDALLSGVIIDLIESISW